MTRESATLGSVRARRTALKVASDIGYPNLQIPQPPTITCDYDDDDAARAIAEHEAGLRTIQLSHANDITGKDVLWGLFVALVGFTIFCGVAFLVTWLVFRHEFG